MDFIDEEDGARAVSAGLFRVGHDLLDLFDSGKHCGELDELRFRHVRNDLRQRGLACPRWSPEDDGAGIIALNLQAKRLTRTDDVLLADKFIERARAHTIGKRARAFALLVRKCLEQTHNKTLPLMTLITLIFDLIASLQTALGLSRNQSYFSALCRRLSAQAGLAAQSERGMATISQF